MDFEKQAAAFHAAVAACGPRGRTTAYPASLRGPALRYSRERIASGVGQTTAARELGLGINTLRRWLRGQMGRPGRRATVRPVRLVEAESRAVPRSIVLHGPAGVRIEGLDLAAVADLFRRLA